MTNTPSDLRTDFINGMGHAACTVNVVTTDGPSGRVGVTVSAMSSVSADTPKPTLLVCVHENSPAADAILGNGVFCMNILRDDQSYISDTFAGRFKDTVKDKFECATWQVMTTGAPRCVDPLVAFDCKVLSSEKVGTHYVFMGEVQEVFVNEKGSPLIYSNRSYGAAWRIDGTASIADGQEASAQRLELGCFKTFGPFIMPELLSRMKSSGSKLTFSMIEGDQRRVQEGLLSGQTEIALLYELGLSDLLDIVPLTQQDPYVLLPVGHELASATSLEVKDLVDHPMILLNAPPSRDYVMGIFEAEQMKPNVVMTSVSVEMVRGLVGRGLGYSILATKPAGDVSYDGQPLVAVPLKTDAPTSKIVMATRKGIPLSKAAEEFAWHCRDYFALEA